MGLPKKCFILKEYEEGLQSVLISLWGKDRDQRLKAKNGGIIKDEAKPRMDFRRVNDSKSRGLGHECEYYYLMFLTQRIKSINNTFIKPAQKELDKIEHNFLPVLWHKLLKFGWFSTLSLTNYPICNCRKFNFAFINEMEAHSSNNALQSKHEN